MTSLEDRCGGIRATQPERGAGLPQRRCPWLTAPVLSSPPHVARAWPSWASSSRSQVAMWTTRAAACLTWEAPSVGVRWRPLLSAGIVNHLVTRSLASRSRERLLRRSSGAILRPVMLELSHQTQVSVDDRLAPPLLLRSGTQRARDHSVFRQGDTHLQSCLETTQTAAR